MVERSQRVKNNVGKGEIAYYEHFLLFPQCFKDLYYRHIKNKALFVNGLKVL